MDYTIADVKRDLRQLKVNDLDPETEERLMEMFRRWKRGELLGAPDEVSQEEQPGEREQGLQEIK